MQYYVKSIGPLIEAKYDDLTQVEKNIADFFINNHKKMDFSVKSMSEKLFVSEASLSRFAKKCGFKGYREFIYQYEGTLTEHNVTITNDIRAVLSSYQELLNSAYSLTDGVQIARIVKYLTEADRVIVCGKGSSGLAATEMESRFMRIGVNIDSLTDTDRMRMQAVFLNRNNLVCGMSLSGETEEVIYLLQESHKRGAKTILFTANLKDAFGKFCDEVVLVPSLKFLNHGNTISPQFPILLVLDMIYYYYVNQDKYGKEMLHDHTLRALGTRKEAKRIMIE